MRLTFWRVCAVWALVLGSYAVARPYLTDRGGSDPEPDLPSVGDTLDLPTTLTTVAGLPVPTLAADRTLFLITWAGCPTCKRELSSYPQLLEMAEQHGFATRMLVLPAQPNDNAWYLERAPSRAIVIFDTLRVGVDGLRARVTPSIVIVGANGVVEAAYSPSRAWPVTSEMLAAVSRSRSFPTRSIPTGRH